jgi:hypothetical protein
MEMYLQDNLKIGEVRLALQEDGFEARSVSLISTHKYCSG